jgi:hypothetical protein
MSGSPQLGSDAAGPLNAPKSTGIPSSSQAAVASAAVHVNGQREPAQLEPKPNGKAKIAPVSLLLADDPCSSVVNDAMKAGLGPEFTVLACTALRAGKVSPCL